MLCSERPRRSFCVRMSWKRLALRSLVSIHCVSNLARTMSSLPARMRCIEAADAGGPEVLRVGERSLPQVPETHVLVKVAAAGVNRPDCLQRRGLYPPPPGASDLLGLEVSGEVVAVGSAVDRISVGDRVCALAHGGGYAEYCSVHAGHCLSLTTLGSNISLVDAAGIPETYFTVWYNVFMRAKLQAGEWMLVHGGSSGIGSAAIQLAKARGAKVIATAGSADKCQYAAAIGADVVVNYKTEDFVAKAREATDGQGVNVVLDMVAGDYFPRNLASLAPDGRYALIAFLGGSKVDRVDLGPILRKRLTVHGSTLRAQSDSVKESIAKELQEHVVPLLREGKCNPMVTTVLPLADASVAHTKLETGDNTGKIVLTIE